AADATASTIDGRSLVYVRLFPMKRTRVAPPLGVVASSLLHDRSPPATRSPTDALKKRFITSTMRVGQRSPRTFGTSRGRWTAARPNTDLTCRPHSQSRP